MAFRIMSQTSAAERAAEEAAEEADRRRAHLAKGESSTLVTTIGAPEIRHTAEGGMTFRFAVRLPGGAASFVILALADWQKPAIDALLANDGFMDGSAKVALHVHGRRGSFGGHTHIDAVDVAMA